MEFIIKHFAPFTWMKRAIIRAALAGMSEQGKAKMISDVIAAEIPRYRIGLMPYRKNPEKKYLRRQRQAELEEAAG